MSSKNISVIWSTVCIADDELSHPEHQKSWPQCREMDYFPSRDIFYITQTTQSHLQK